jgi:hypothetical protein
MPVQAACQLGTAQSAPISGRIAGQASIDRSYAAAPRKRILSLHRDGFSFRGMKNTTMASVVNPFQAVSQAIA